MTVASMPWAAARGGYSILARTLLHGDDRNLGDPELGQVVRLRAAAGPRGDRRAGLGRDWARRCGRLSDCRDHAAAVGRRGPQLLGAQARRRDGLARLSRRSGLGPRGGQGEGRGLALDRRLRGRRWRQELLDADQVDRARNLGGGLAVEVGEEDDGRDDGRVGGGRRGEGYSLGARGEGEGPAHFLGDSVIMPSCSTPESLMTETTFTKSP